MGSFPKTYIDPPGINMGSHASVLLEEQASSLISHWYKDRARDFIGFSVCPLKKSNFPCLLDHNSKHAHNREQPIEPIEIIGSLDLKSELAQVQIISRLFHLVLFVKFW